MESKKENGLRIFRVLNLQAAKVGLTLSPKTPDKSYLSIGCFDFIDLSQNHSSASNNIQVGCNNRLSQKPTRSPNPGNQSSHDSLVFPQSTHHLAPCNPHQLILRRLEFSPSKVSRNCPNSTNLFR